ncbi:unnamed protein product [Prunus armeniaca]
MEREQFLSDLQFQQILSIMNNKGANQSSNPKANAAGTSSSLSQAPLRLRRLILDSGATDHITSSPNLLVNSRNTILLPVIMPSGEQAPITSTETLPLNSVISLKNVLGVPSFKDLMTKTTIGLGKQRDGLYYLVALASATPSPKFRSSAAIASHPSCSHVTSSTDLWHRRLGHLSSSRLDFMAKNLLNFPFKSNNACDHKSETQHLLTNFFSFVKTQFAASIANIQVDNRGEFSSMKDFFQQNGTTYQHSCVYTPQQNGVVERKHRHILELARALRFQAHLPLRFWAECVLTAVHLINRLPRPLLSQQTPFERLYGKTPSYSHLKVFGCLAYATDVHVPHKFAPRAKRCVFLGYPVGQKAYKLYDLTTHKFFTSRDIVFHETIFPYASLPSIPTPPAPVLPHFVSDPPISDSFPTSPHPATSTFDQPIPASVVQPSPVPP